jgi:CubicO group peptidase (beta-lactamase class C family)
VRQRKTGRPVRFELTEHTCQAVDIYPKVCRKKPGEFLDHLGTRIATLMQPGELLLGTQGYTFGLGFAVRQGDGIAGVPGSAGEFMWAGYAGTYFWVDPKEEIVGVYLTQAPSPIRAYYRKMFKTLVYQSLVD